MIVCIIWLVNSLYTVIKVFCCQFSAVKNILKKIIILLKQQIKAQKPIRFKSRPMKFKSAFREAEAKWRDQISLTAGNETEVPIYFGSRK